MKAFITGATKGIGKCLAEYAAAKGFDLIITARNDAELERLCNKLKSNYNINTQWKSADLTDLNDIEALADYLKENNPDILINNAGAADFSTFSELPECEDLKKLNLNITAPMILAKAFLNSESSNKHLLFTTSTVAFRAAPGLSVYSASKSFICNFTKSIALEYPQTKISLLCPGKTSTNFNPADRSGMSPEKVAQKALDGLIKGKKIIIPGISNKIKILYYKYMPSTLTNYLVRISR